jgi:hypothetical protein
MTISASRLPDRFPVGSKYVVEGCGGGDGNLRVFSRYIVMPDGRRIDLPTDFARPTRQRTRFRRHRDSQPNARPAGRPARRLVKNHV